MLQCPFRPRPGVTGMPEGSQAGGITASTSGTVADPASAHDEFRRGNASQGLGQDIGHGDGVLDQRLIPTPRLAGIS